MRVRAVTAVVSCALFAACGGGGGGGGGGHTGTSEDLASVQPSPTAAARNSGPGAFAADFLRSTNFDALLVEIDYPSGNPPSAQALTLLQDRLEERCDKPNGITLMLDDSIPSEEFDDVMSLSEVEDLEEEHRDFYSDLGTHTAVVYCLYTSGASDEDTDDSVIVGYAYRGSSIVIFQDNAVGGFPGVTDAEVEGYTLVHEFGHMLGMVNNGVPMVEPHEDPDHEAHDSNPDSVMFWQVNIDPVLPNIGDPTFAQFGPECIADMQDFGGL